MNNERNFNIKITCWRSINSLISLLVEMLSVLSGVRNRNWFLRSSLKTDHGQTIIKIPKINISCRISKINTGLIFSFLYFYRLMNLQVELHVRAVFFFANCPKIASKNNNIIRHLKRF